MSHYKTESKVQFNRKCRGNKLSVTENTNEPQSKFIYAKITKLHKRKARIEYRQ